jgi:hypothetical protein
MAEKEKTENSQGGKDEVKKPSTPKFARPRITVPQAAREAARSNMAGEAMVKSAVATPDQEPAAAVLSASPELEPKVEPENTPAENPKEQGIEIVAAPAPEEKKSRGAGRKAAPVVENHQEETKNVRVIQSLWLNAKFNLVQLNGSNGPQNLTDYADEAFRHYEKYLLSSGKITKTRTGK